MENQVSHSLKILVVAVIGLILSGCSHGRFILEGERAAIAVGVNEHRPARAAQYDIPPGHMPPPGSCRIWYPGTPPGHQPPPGDCYLLADQVPPGAWLIRG